jgi:hypothetical protein
MINYGEIVKDCLIAIGVGAIGLFVLNVYIKYSERKEAQPKL